MVEININKNTNLNSAGHRIGQIIGDWWEEKVIFPLLREVAAELNLFVDNRVVSRTCRKEKIKWSDSEGNSVDYDYVLELGGTKSEIGIPVAFLESFWRKGSRHSKDKARDDTNKLLPMRDTYPTARFLAIAACGEFTAPAKEYVTSRNVELFYISKQSISQAFKSIGLDIDYPDNLPEEEKLALATELESLFLEEKQSTAAEKLKEFAGITTFHSFKQKIISALTATPQTIEIFSLERSGPVIFESADAADLFLSSKEQPFPKNDGQSSYEYRILFSDGTNFSKEFETLDEIRDINSKIILMNAHFTDALKKKSII